MKIISGSACIFTLLFVVGNTPARSFQFHEEYSRFLKEYTKGGRIEYKKVTNNQKAVNELTAFIKTVQPKSLDANARKAFWINAYNILAIKTVVENYPVRSPKQISGFFTNIKHSLGGERLTLDEIEHKKILKEYKDARVHFAIVCASQGCPKIRNKPYQGIRIDQELEEQAKLAANDPYFVHMNKDTQRLKLSELFRWYKNDFTQDAPSIIAFLNRYRKDKIPESTAIQWIKYDWTLNDAATTTKRNTYFDSSALRNKGGLEVKTYNNVYTQAAMFDSSLRRGPLDKRSTYFTSITGFYYGIHDQWNLGLDLFVRSVRDHPKIKGPFQAFEVFGFGSNTPEAHSALTAVAPKVKFAPFASLPYLSMQATLLIPTGRNFQGTGGEHPFLEWDALQLWYEIYYDLYIGESYSIFFAFGLFPRLGWAGGGINAGISGYYKTFFQYFFDEVFTFYAVVEVFGFVLNGGIGTKILIDRAFQIDILWTHSLIGRNENIGTTYNLGVSYSY